MGPRGPPALTTIRWPARSPALASSSLTAPTMASLSSRRPLPVRPPATWPRVAPGVAAPAPRGPAGEGAEGGGRDDLAGGSGKDDVDAGAGLDELAGEVGRLVGGNAA